MMLRPLIGTLGETAGLVPVRDDDRSPASYSLRPREFSTAIVLRIRETRRAGQHLDAVARKLRLRDIDLGLDHVLHAERQIRHRDLFFHPVVDAIDVLILVSREMQHRFAHGLAGDGAGVDAGAADHFALFDQRDLLAGFGALYSRPLPGGAGADDDQIVVRQLPPNLPQIV